MKVLTIFSVCSCNKTMALKVLSKVALLKSIICFASFNGFHVC